MNALKDERRSIAPLRLVINNDKPRAWSGGRYHYFRPYTVEKRRLPPRSLDTGNPRTVR